MGIHLYCMLERSARDTMPNGLNGLAGRSVRALKFDDVEAWVSDVPRGLPVTIDAVKVHDEVVEAALATGATPVPARYGQRFDSDQSCGDALSRRIGPLRTLLSRVAGCVEMTLIVTPSTGRMMRDLEAELPPETRSEASSGPAYLEGLRARTHGDESARTPGRRLLARIHKAVAPWTRGEATHAPVVRRFLMTASHLIERRAPEPYRAAVAAVSTGSDLRVLVVGPRAPYSFCAVQGSGLGTHGMNLAD
jgi:gas vesicle protein GvpL/GvpF